MSQWGIQIEIHGAVFVPLVATTAFEQVKKDSCIADIILIDDGRNSHQAKSQLAILKKELVGMNYCVWGWLLDLTLKKTVETITPSELRQGKNSHRYFNYTSITKDFSVTVK